MSESLTEFANRKRKEAEEICIALEAWMNSQQIALNERPPMLAMACGKAIKKMESLSPEIGIMICQLIMKASL